jgi:hypothetical protein
VTAPTRIPFGRVLRLGGRTALSLWASVLAVFAAETIGALALLALFLFSGFLFIRGETRALWPAAFGLSALWVIAQLLRTIALGGALDQGVARLREAELSPFADAAVRTSPRTLSWFGWTLLLEITRALWTWLAIGLAGYAFMHALAQGGGLLQTVLLALALTLALPLGAALTLWTEIALVRAIAKGQGVLVSLADAAAILWERPLAPIGLWLLTAALIGGFRFAISVSGAAPGEDVWHLLTAVTVISVAMRSFVAAVLDLVRLQSLLALELDREGRLPSPPPPRAIPVAEVILTAEIVDARPAAPQPEPGA